MISIVHTLQRTKRATVLAVIGLAIAMQLVVVRTFGVNSLVWDEYYYVPFVKSVVSGKGWFKWFGMWHNEHRMVPTKLLLALVVPPTRWNTIVLLYISVFCAALVIYGLWRIYRLAGGVSLWLFVPVAWLVCSLGGFENMLYGMQVGFYVTVLAFVWLIVSLTASAANAIVLPVALGLVATTSTINGLLVWPIGLLVLAISNAPRRNVVIWGVVSVATTVLYFADSAPLDPTSGGAPATQLVGYAAAVLGATFGAESLAWSAVAGLVIFLIALGLASRWRRSDRALLQHEVGLACLMAFGIGSAVMIALGRVASETSPLQSRYQIFSAMATAGVYLIACKRAERREGSPVAVLIALAVLIPSLVMTDINGWTHARGWHRERMREQYLMQTIESQPDDEVRNLYFLTDIRSYAADLRTAQWGPYSEPQRLLLLTRWQEGWRSDEIAAGSAIEQRFVCSVDTLWDVATTVEAFVHREATPLRISVWEGRRELGASSILPSSLTEVTWVPVRLQPPVRDCMHRALLLRVEGARATGVLSWMYRPYFDGELRQGGQLLPSRSVGLALNGFHFDELP